jgi:hypothetical protein
MISPVRFKFTRPMEVGNWFFDLSRSTTNHLARYAPYPTPERYQAIDRPIHKKPRLMRRHATATKRMNRRSHGDGSQSWITSIMDARSCLSAISGLIRKYIEGIPTRRALTTNSPTANITSELIDHDRGLMSRMDTTPETGLSSPVQGRGRCRVSRTSRSGC